MKNLIMPSLVLCFLLVCFGAYGQVILDSVILNDSIVVDTVIAPGPGQTEITLPLIEEWFAKGMGPIMMALTILFGYISKWVPLFNKIDDASYRVLAFTVLLGAGFAYFGTDIWQVAVSYAGATSLYELIFKKILGGSPRTDGKPASPSVLTK